MSIAQILILIALVVFGGLFALFAIARRAYLAEYRKAFPVRPEAHGCYEEPSKYAQQVAKRRERDALRIRAGVFEFETDLARASKSRWN